MRGCLYFSFPLRHGYTLYYTIPNGRGANDQKINIYIYTLCSSGTRVIHGKTTPGNYHSLDWRTRLAIFGGGRLTRR